MSVFDDDPELLRAALEIIEGWEVDAETPHGGVAVAVAAEEEREVCARDAASPQDSTENESADGSDDSSAAHRLRGKKELKASTLASTRVRRREEIIYLRDRVKEMEQQLEQLQKVEKKPADPTDSSHAISAVWKDVAGRQQRMRQRSELEQAKLKDQLAIQMKVAKGLVKLIQKAKGIDEHDDFPQPKRSRIGTDVSATRSIANRLQRVQVLYEERHMAFMHEKFIDGSLKFIDISASEEHDDHMVLKVCEAWTVPFVWRRVLEAVWTYHIKRSQDTVCQPDYDASVCMQDDVLMSHFSASTSSPCFAGKFNGTLVAKRFSSADAAVAAIISHMVVNPGETESSYQGLLTHGDFWLRMIPLASEKPGGEMTLVQCRQRFRIYYDGDNAAGSKIRAGYLSEFILDHVKRDVDLRHEVVETLLLEGHH